MQNENELKLEIGDVVFTYLNIPLFKNIANATNCWSNHVGIIVGHDSTDYIVAESKVPFTSTCHFNRFIARSKNKKYAVRRLIKPLSEQEKKLISQEALRKKNIFYNLGFNLDSKLQFCSKFVYEIYRDVLKVELGKIETFQDIFNNTPTAKLIIWKIWFLGQVPWQRRTVTPASLYFCPQLQTLIE